MDQTKEIVITPNRKVLDLKLAEIWKYRTLVYMFVKRDFITYYKQTILGPLWYVVSPMLSTVMYMIVFGRLAGLGTDGIPQPLFYFSGTILWTLFNENLIKVSKTFSQNKDLFGKVYFPRIVVPVAGIISSMIKLVIQLLLFTVLYVWYLHLGYMTAGGMRTVFFIVPVIWIVILAMSFGMIISSVTTKYRDVAIAIEFVLSLVMYATPIVYPVSQAKGLIGTVLRINPVTAPVELFRYAFFGTSAITSSDIVYSAVFTVMVFFAGMIMFNRNEKIFIDVI